MNIRRIYHFAIITLLIVFSGVLFFAEKLSISKNMRLDETQRKLLAGLFFVYGLFRLYRVIKQKDE